MPVLPSYERFTHAAVFTLGARDRFAEARQPANIIPPVLGGATFFVKERVSAPVLAFEPPLEFVSWRNGSDFFLFSGETRTPGIGGTRVLAPGRYRWRLETDYYQVDEFVDDWPPAQVYDPAKDRSLLPGPAYPFPNLDMKQRDLGVTLVRGTLLTPDGTGIPNVKVKLIAPPLAGTPFVPFTECVTDDRGEWVLAIVDRQTDDQRAQDPQPDFANSVIRVNLPVNPYDVALAIVSGTENSLRQTALRGQVLRANGTAFPGVKITNSVTAGESVTRADGQWFLYFELRQPAGAVTVTATAPGVGTDSKNSMIVPRSTVVVPAMRI
jgi:hypothetical protein